MKYLKFFKREIYCVVNATKACLVEYRLLDLGAGEMVVDYVGRFTKI